MCNDNEKTAKPRVYPQLNVVQRDNITRSTYNTYSIHNTRVHQVPGSSGCFYCVRSA